MPDAATRCPTTTYSGCIRFFYVVEPYMPDRCLRQLGYIQKVPMPILQPMSVVRSSRVVLYSFKFSNSDVVWERFRASRLHISDYTPCTYASEEELGYAMWYNTRSHRKLLPNKISKDWVC